MLVENVVLFLHSGGIACLWPFLTLHLLHNGASIPTASTTLAIVSLLGSFGVPLAALMLKKFENYRLVLLSNILISLLAYNLLLVLAPGEQHGGKSLNVQLHCDYQGTTVYIPKCEHTSKSCSTILAKHHWMHLNLNNCTCSQNNEQKQLKSIICFEGNRATNCEIVDQFQSTADSILLEYVEETLNETETYCQFTTNRAMVHQTQVDSVHCLDCSIHCFSKTQVATPRESLLASGQSLPISWYIQYIITRGIAEMTSSAATFLLASATDTAEIVTMFSFAQFSPISGAFIDWATATTGKESFDPCFYFFTAVTAATAFLSLLLHETHTWFPSVFQCQKRMLNHDREFFCFFATILLLGALWGYSDTFLPVFYHSLCADKTFIGLTAVAAFLPVIPILIKFNAVIEKISSTACIIVAFIAYSGRFTAYVFVSDVRWSLVVECLRGLGLQLPWLALVQHVSKIVPRDMLASAQLLAMVLHFNFGRSLGCLIGGYLTYKLGFTEVFMIMASISGLTSCIYFFTNIIFFFNKNFDI